MIASHNASGAEVGVLAVLERLGNAALSRRLTPAECDELYQARATIESAMALPGKWRVLAKTLRDHGEFKLAGQADRMADELETIFGPAPPATDAPDTITVNRADYALLECTNEQLRERLRNCETALEERDAQLLAATPPAGGGREGELERAAYDILDNLAAARGGARVGQESQG